MSGLGNPTTIVRESNDQKIDGLLDGARWAGERITYSFAESADEYDYGGLFLERYFPIDMWVMGFVKVDESSPQREAFAFALDADIGANPSRGFSIESITSLGIDEASSRDLGSGPSQIRIAQSSTMQMPSVELDASLADVPGSRFTNSGVLGVDVTLDDGDLWLATNSPRDLASPSAGNIAWWTVLHETGHALGLKHAHEETFGSEIYNFGALPKQFDALEFSVMSYRAYVGGFLPTPADPTPGDRLVANQFTLGEFSYPQTYMMLDIAALQHMYGADFSANGSNVGNTVYSWSPDNGDTRINGQVAIDAVGDVIFATVWDAGGIDTYDLSAFTTDLDVWLAPGAALLLNEDQLANLGSNSDGELQRPRGNIYNALQYQDDPQSLIENVIGGAGDDILAGNQISNTITGGAGSDLIIGGPFFDDTGIDLARFEGARGDYDVTIEFDPDRRQTIDFGNPYGVSRLSPSPKHVITDLRLDTVGDRDLLFGIEQISFSDTGPSRIVIVGSDASDQLVGDDNANIILGLSGSDRILAGGGGDYIVLTDLRAETVIEQIDGGDGIDTLDLSSATLGRNAAGLGVRISDLDPIDIALGVEIRSIENLVGTNGWDALQGNVGSNTIWGLEEDDLIEGLAGDDVLFGGDGTDRLVGGADNDRLSGGDGNDILEGGRGRDTLIGGEGDDDFVFNVLDGTDVDEIIDLQPGDQVFLLDADGGRTATPLMVMRVGPFETNRFELSWELADTTFRIEVVSPMGEAALRDAFFVGETMEVARATEPLLVNAPPVVTTSNIRLAAGNEVQLSSLVSSMDFDRDQIVSYEISDGRSSGSFRINGSEVDANNGYVVTNLDDVTVFGITGGGTNNLSVRAFDGQAWSNWSPFLSTSVLPLVLRGSSEGDVIRGDIASDRLFGSDGDDRIAGGDDDDWLYGENENDRLWGEHGSDTLVGGDGADQLFGGTGADRLLGDDGNDRIFGGAGKDNINGGAGSDVIAAENDNDRIHGGTGDDRIFGGAGNDTVWAQDGSDQVNGGDGDDHLLGGIGNDYLHGKSGNDRIWGQSGNDSIWGNNGVDRLQGGEGDDAIVGGEGDDFLAGNENDDRLWGGDGHDDMRGGDGNDRLNGGAGDDSMWGNDGDDQLWGFSGNDVIRGDDGNDWLVGHEGFDTLWGGDGSDTLDGRSDDDALVAGSGDDSLFGGDGDDRLWGEAGNDRLEGGTGSDRLDGGLGDDLLLGGDGDDHLWGYGGDDTFHGGDGNDWVLGHDGDDIAYGGSGNDTLRGYDGADSLFGGDGDDRLAGYAGEDALKGGIGNDILWGGLDADQFIFSLEDGNDIIQDFQFGQDIIVFEAASFDFEDLSVTHQFGDLHVELSATSVIIKGGTSMNIGEDAFVFV